MIRLIGSDGRQVYTFELEAGSHVVGRKGECDVCVADRTVSRRHAEVKIVAGEPGCLITDLGSHNGTAVNGLRLTEPVRVRAGDTVTFGQVEFKVAEGGTGSSDSHRMEATRLAATEPEKSVFLDINEALKPLPSKVTERPEVMPTVFELARMLVLPEPQEEMLERSLQLISRVIPADRLAVLVRAEEGEETQDGGEGDSGLYTVATLLPGNKEMGEFRLSSTIAGQILSQKQAILIGDPMEDPRFAEQQSIIMSEMKSAMAVPLFDEGNVHGILYVDTTNRAHSYTDEYLRLLATFGNIVGSRMQSYTLLKERHEKQVIDAELRRAASIQENLLTHLYPEMESYAIHAHQEQSRAVGGDLYDVAALKDGRVLFLVADVSGKGMGAALLMSNILAAFRILYEETDFDLLRSVIQTSNQLFKYSAPENFATLFIGLLDEKKNEVRFINAGHNPPLLVRRNGTLDHLQPSGIMIGAMQFDEWKEEAVAMEPGDSIVVFTDGVTEAERDGKMYGDARLEKAALERKDLPADEMCHQIIHDIRTFVEDAPQSDDITMLIVQRKA